MLRQPLFAKKKAAGEGGGGGTGDLGLKGEGVERVEIPGMDEALLDYRTKRDTRIAATKEEVKAKDAVLTLFHANAEKLADPKGTLRYLLQDDDALVKVHIEAAKEKVKFGKLDTAADDEHA